MNKIVICIFLITGWVACKQKPSASIPPVPVNLMTAAAQRVWYYDQYPSTTAALSQVTLNAEVEGYITGIYFTEGSYVKKGQKLYEIDRSLYLQNHDLALANMEVAKGNLTEANQDADRYIYLNKHNAVAKQLLDHAVIAQQNAVNMVKAADETVKTAETNLKYSIITAPFDGTIGFSMVKMGNLITVGSTVLVTISSDNPMAVDFLINEQQLQYYVDIEQGKYNQVDSLFTILMPNGTLYPYPGKITVIDRAVDPQTGTIQIRLVFPNPKHLLRAGMSCVVRVHNLQSRPQIVIPDKAIIEQMGEYFVFVAKDTLQAGTATASSRPKFLAFQKKVQPGQIIGANVIIQSGITPGDKIVVDGIQALHEGSEVTYKKP
jgi:RND family efflux transporter MFP subunit